MAQIKQYRKETVTAIEYVLQNNQANMTGVVLRLAWLAGLTRDEITELTWDQIDFDGKTIRLSDRAIPFDGDIETCLCRWKTICANSSELVVVNDNKHKPIEPQSISRIVRKELNNTGLETVCLRDLRNLFVLRQAELYGWEYAIRVAGISVTTYRYFYGAGKKKVVSKSNLTQITKLEWEKLKTVLEENQKSPEGIALWLSWYCGLTEQEIVSLVWEQIDFEQGIIHSKGKYQKLSDEVASVLKNEKSRRSNKDDLHIILSPRAKKPIAIDRLSVMTRSLLVRNGIDNVQMGMLQRERVRLNETEKLNRYIAEHGSISRKECCGALGISPDAAYRRLSSLESAGVIMRINRRYYPADQAAKPFEYENAIIHYLAEHEATKEDIKELLHIGMRPVYHLLTCMVNEGKLTKARKDKFYRLSESTAKSVRAEGGKSNDC